MDIWLKRLAILGWTLAAAGYLLASWQTASMTAGLLALHALLVAAALAHQRAAKTQANPIDQGVAWLSAALPLTLRLTNETLTGQVTNLIGLGLTTWALLTLGQGRAFSVAPADRGLIATGPYQFIRHPMYAGELLSVTGVVFWGSFSVWNLLVLGLLFISLLRRIRVEEQMVSGYRSYTYTVPWRLFPGVW